MTIEFTPWPKTPRLFRDAIVTEKIDGTNAAVIVEAEPHGADGDDVVEIADDEATVATLDAHHYRVGAQSRKRLITPEADNFGFALWVRENQDDLVRILGSGVHFGEWWGSGIQRGYGLTNGDKRFSLFNVHRYAHVMTTVGPEVPGLGLVPVLGTSLFDTEVIRQHLQALRTVGSLAAPGFMRPEGVVVFHSAAGSVFKALIENDDTPKGDVQ